MNTLVILQMLAAAAACGIVACIAYLAMKFAPRKAIGLTAVLGFVAFAVSSALAQTDAGAIVTSAGATFTAVSTLCVTIGTFFVVYRLAKRVK